ncbi:MAG: glycerate kinase [Vicinamibacterales bacterium]
MRAAIEGVEPTRLVERHLQGGLSSGLVSVLAVGKAAVPMALGACRSLRERIVRGRVIAPDLGGEPRLPHLLTFLPGDHPIPTARSERAGREALAFADQTGPDGILLFLVSGGASALMAVPADGVSLDDKQRTTARLLKAGVTIHELNTVRKHLSAVKGGRLAAATAAVVRTLAISDVVDDDPAVIGSGPTVPDASTFADALAIVRRTGGPPAYPASVIDRLERGAAGDGSADETPKPGDARLTRGVWTLIGGRHDAMRAAADEARRRGFAVHVREAPVVGEARDAAAAWARWLRDVATSPGPQCVVSSGETTVTVRGSGKGGRNQEFALALVEALRGIPRSVAVASIGTDGVDGPTDAAGALVRSDSAARAEAGGLPPPSHFLAANDAYAYFDALGDLLRTGPTGTNVGDVQVGLIR